MVDVSAGLGVEDNDRAGEEIVPLTDAVVEVGRGGEEGAAGAGAAAPL